MRPGRPERLFDRLAFQFAYNGRMRPTGSSNHSVLLALILVALWGASAHAITIDTVPIGNPGNPADLRYAEFYHPNGFGSVAQSFNIGKTEVTNKQYVEFLNAVAASDPYALYNTGMGSDTRGEP